MDMHSGGGTKLGKFEKILMQGREDDATKRFTELFGRDPNHVTCDCCGEDYSVGEYATLAEATLYDREKYTYAEPFDWRARPTGKTVESIEDYLAKDTVLVIYKDGSSNHPYDHLT